MASTDVAPGYLGKVLLDVLQGDLRLTSPTDFVMDVHHMAVTLVAYMDVWTERGDAREIRAAGKLQPLFAKLRDATSDKYAVVSDD